jgi:hypothetical protein
MALPVCPWCNVAILVGATVTLEAEPNPLFFDAAAVDPARHAAAVAADAAAPSAVALFRARQLGDVGPLVGVAVPLATAQAIAQRLLRDTVLLLRAGFSLLRDTVFLLRAGCSVLQEEVQYMLHQLPRTLFCLRPAAATPHGARIVLFRRS